MAPQLKNEYKLNICWIQLFTDFFFAAEEKEEEDYGEKRFGSEQKAELAAHVG